MNYNQIVGKRIKESRINAGLTLEDLGNMVGLTKSTITKYERGEIKSLDVSKIKEFADVLNVKASYLAGWNSKSSLELKLFDYIPGIVREISKNEETSFSEIKELYDKCLTFISEEENCKIENNKITYDNYLKKEKVINQIPKVKQEIYNILLKVSDAEKQKNNQDREIYFYLLEKPVKKKKSENQLKALDNVEEIEKKIIEQKKIKKDSIEILYESIKKAKIEEAIYDKLLAKARKELEIEKQIMISNYTTSTIGKNKKNIDKIFSKFEFHNLEKIDKSLVSELLFDMGKKGILDSKAITIDSPLVTDSNNLTNNLINASINQNWIIINQLSSIKAKLVK